MKTLEQYINEELDDWMFWLLDKWFENDETQKQEFLSIIVQYPKNKKVKELLQNTKLLNNLPQFLSFINNTLEVEYNESNMFSSFEIIVKAVLDNHSKKNNYKKNGTN